MLSFFYKVSSLLEALLCKETRGWLPQAGQVKGKGEGHVSQEHG